jgi:hypothetical protein
MKNKHNIEIYRVVCLDCMIEGELAYWNKDTSCPECKKPMMPEKKADRILKYRYYKIKLLNLLQDNALFSYGFHLFSGMFIVLYFFHLHRPEPIFISLGLLLFLKYYFCPDDRPNLTLLGALIGVILGVILNL